MGKRGPRPTPTANLKLRGSWRGNIERGEPQPRRGEPPRPDWFSPEESAVWERMVEILSFMGILSHADGNALARYCTTWVRWRKAEEFIARFGTTYPVKDERGKTKCFMAFPEVAIANQLSQTLTKLEAEFGLTPSSRTRISIEVGVPLRPRGPDPLDAARQAFFETSPTVWKPPKPARSAAKKSAPADSPSSGGAA